MIEAERDSAWGLTRWIYRRHSNRPVSRCNEESELKRDQNSQTILLTDSASFHVEAYETIKEKQTLMIFILAELFYIFSFPFLWLQMKLEVIVIPPRMKRRIFTRYHVFRLRYMWSIFILFDIVVAYLNSELWSDFGIDSFSIGIVESEIKDVTKKYPNSHRNWYLECLRVSDNESQVRLEKMCNSRFNVAVQNPELIIF